MLKPENTGLSTLYKLIKLVEQSTKDSGSGLPKGQSYPELLLKRQAAVEFVEASDALEGYSPITPEDGIAYELREMWLNGQIDTDERVRLLLKASLEN